MLSSYKLDILSWITASVTHAIGLMLTMQIELVRMPVVVEHYGEAPVMLLYREDQTFLHCNPAWVEVETESPYPAWGHQDAVSTIPAEGTGTIGFHGVGSGGASGAFGWIETNDMERRRGYRLNGGTEGLENAVRTGLDWLARQQRQEDGSWGDDGELRMPAARVTRAGLTGLAMLAFMGAGHTSKSGDYQGGMRSALWYLEAVQDRRGGIGVTGYDHAISGMVLAEALRLTGDEELREPAQLALDRSFDVYERVRPSGRHLGWTRQPGHAPGTDAVLWFVLQIKSAERAGLELPEHAWLGARDWIGRVHPRVSTGTPPSKPVLMPASNRLNGPATPLATAMAVLIRRQLGTEWPSPEVTGAAAYLRQHLPGIEPEDPLDIDYAWLGSVAMLSAGGVDWERWNEHLREPLAARQEPITVDHRGSWNPDAGAGDSVNARIYTTALAVLTLELCYRYMPTGNYGEYKETESLQTIPNPEE